MPWGDGQGVMEGGQCRWLMCYNGVEIHLTALGYEVIGDRMEDVVFVHDSVSASVEAWICQSGSRYLRD